MSKDALKRAFMAGLHSTEEGHHVTDADMLFEGWYAEQIELTIPQFAGTVPPLGIPPCNYSGTISKVCKRCGFAYNHPCHDEKLRKSGDRRGIKAIDDFEG